MHAGEHFSLAVFLGTGRLESIHRKFFCFLWLSRPSLDDGVYGTWLSGDLFLSDELGVGQALTNAVNNRSLAKDCPRFTYCWIAHNATV